MNIDMTTLSLISILNDIAEKTKNGIYPFYQATVRQAHSGALLYDDSKIIDKDFHISCFKCDITLYEPIYYFIGSDIEETYNSIYKENFENIKFYVAIGGFYDPCVIVIDKNNDAIDYPMFIIKNGKWNNPSILY